MAGSTLADAGEIDRGAIALAVAFRIAHSSRMAPAWHTAGWSHIACSATLEPSVTATPIFHGPIQTRLSARILQCFQPLGPPFW